MNNELLLLIKQHTDTVIQRIKSRPHETLEFKMNKQKETFSFSPPINLVEEGECLFGVTSFEATNSVVNVTNENNSFSISTTSHWIPEYAQQTIDNFKEQSEPNKRNLNLHIAEVIVKVQMIYIGEDEYDLSDLDISLLKNEIFEKIKENKYTGLYNVFTDVDDSKGCEHVNIDENAQNSTPTSMTVHSVFVLVLPIIHPTSIEILKIWSLEYN